MNEESKTAGDIEGELRGSLRGSRLVFELGIDQARHRELKVVLAGLARGGYKPATLAQEFPALYATSLVFTGVFEYEGGDFWSAVNSNLSHSNLKPGPAFLEAIHRLDLETFDSLVHRESAQSWIARILAHGGVPISCLKPFAELLVREASSGVPDGTELMSVWAVRPERLERVHQPTRRFISYGGQPALDLLDRCMEALMQRLESGAMPSAAEAGLPQYVLDSLSLAATSAPKHRTNTSGTIPRPRIELEPFGGLGPVAVFPTLEPEDAGGTWTLIGDSEILKSPASALSEASVRIKPGKEFHVEYSGADGTWRRWSFVGLRDQGVVTFDAETGVLLRDPRVLSAEEVWLLVPRDAKVEGRARGTGAEIEPRQVQELPEMAGAWGPYRVVHLDLEGLGQLVIERDGESTHIPVLRPKERPRLDGAVVYGAETPSGDPVFSAKPFVRAPDVRAGGESNWTVRVRSGDFTRTEVLTAADGMISLQEVLPEDGWGEYRITVRGPLGSDLSTAFCVVPGLTVERPDHVIRPIHSKPVASVSAPGASVNGGSADQRANLEFGESEAALAVELTRLGSHRIDLRVKIDRLLWAVVHESKPAVLPSVNVDRVGKEEFDDQLADLLHVQTGRKGVPVKLELHANDALVAESRQRETAGRSGQWTFDLGIFGDQIRASEEGRLSIQLVMGKWTVHVADVIAKVDLISAVVTPTNDGRQMVAFEKTREVSNLVARLWSNVRPWEKPIEVGVPDGASVVGFQQIEPGPYLFQIDVADDWIKAVRPSAFDRSVRKIKVGEREDFDAYLAGLDAQDPLTVLVWALADWHSDLEPDPESLETVSGEIALVCLMLLDQSEPGLFGPRAFSNALDLLTKSDSVLATGIVRAAESDASDVVGLARLALRVIPTFDPIADPVPAATLERLWAACGPIAALLDLPSSGIDLEARERCRRGLSWIPEDGEIDPSGGKLSQMEVSLPAEILADVRKAVDLVPDGRLDSAELASATFDWLLTQAKEEDESNHDDLGIPRNWHRRYEAAFASDFGEDLTSEFELLSSHLSARQPVGTVSWAALPVVTLLAASNLAWRTDAWRTALGALDVATSFARRLVEHDLLVALAIQEAVRASNRVAR